MEKDNNIQTAPAQNPPAHDVNPSQTAGVETQPPKPKRHIPWPKILVAGIVILITLLAFGLIAYLVIGQNKNQENQITETQVSAPSPTPDPTANWETYINEEYGYSIKYPTDWAVKEYPASSSGSLQLTAFNPGSVDNRFSAVYISIYPKEYNDEEITDATGYPSINIDGFKAIKKNGGGHYNRILGVAAPLQKDKTIIFNSSEDFNDIFEQILSTFKFTDSDLSTETEESGWITTTSSKYNFKISYPPEATFKTSQIPQQSLDLNMYSYDLDYLGGSLIMNINACDIGLYRDGKTQTINIAGSESIKYYSTITGDSSITLYGPSVSKNGEEYLTCFKLVLPDDENKDLVDDTFDKILSSIEITK